MTAHAAKVVDKVSPSRVVPNPTEKAPSIQGNALQQHQLLATDALMMPPPPTTPTWQTSNQRQNVSTGGGYQTPNDVKAKLLTGGTSAQQDAVVLTPDADAVPSTPRQVRFPNHPAEATTTHVDSGAANVNKQDLMSTSTISSKGFDEANQEFLLKQRLLEDGYKEHVDSLMELTSLLSMEHAGMLMYETAQLDSMKQLDEVMKMADELLML